MSENFANVQWLLLSRVSHFGYKNMGSGSFVKLNRVSLFEFEIRMDLFRIVFLLLGKCKNGSAVYIYVLMEDNDTFFISLLFSSIPTSFFFSFFYQLHFSFLSFHIPSFLSFNSTNARSDDVADQTVVCSSFAVSSLTRKKSV